MIELGTRVIVPGYQIQNDLDGQVLLAEEHHRTGSVAKMMSDGQAGPGQRTWCFVLLDEPLGNNEIRQCELGQLVPLET